MKFRTMLLAGMMLAGAHAYASDLPPGLQCDTHTTVTTEPAHQVKNLNAQIQIKFVEHAWRIVSQDGVLKTDVTLKPMRVTDEAFVLAEGNNETTAKGVHLVTSPLTVDRKTGEYSMTMKGDMPASPNLHITSSVTGHCAPADL